MVKDIDSRLAWSYRSKQHYIKSRELSLSTMNMPVYQQILVWNLQLHVQ